MSRSSRSSAAGVSTPGAVLSVAALAVVVAVAFAAAGASPDPSDPPAAPVVTPLPSVPATPVVTPAPSEPTAPTPAPSRGVDGAEIALDVFLGHDVALGISDPGNLVVGATSGTAGDGMSVRWGSSIVRNLDANTIEVTWVGFPRDELVTLVVKAEGDGVLLRFGQAAPPAFSDAMGADRVAVLTFASPVSAEDVTTDFTTADD